MSETRELRIIWQDGATILWRLDDDDEGWNETNRLEVEATPEGMDVTVEQGIPGFIGD